MEKFLKNLGYGEPLSLANQVEYLPGQVVSKTVAQNPAFGMTLFAIPGGEGISAHKSPGDAFVYILDGKAEVTIDETACKVEKGQFIIMPAGHPHALKALESFKMLLVAVFQ